IRLYCNLTDLEDEEDQEGLNIPVRCAGVTDLDPPKKQTIQVASEENEDETIDKEVDFIPHDSHLLEGMNHAIKLVN
ncbi:hypothetical protein OFN42_44220, partial [Escherichia coli]|nr:hypothetical protein [Escherichia coli]